MGAAASPPGARPAVPGPGRQRPRPPPAAPRVWRQGSILAEGTESFPIRLLFRKEKKKKNRGGKFYNLGRFQSECRDTSSASVPTPPPRGHLDVTPTPQGALAHPRGGMTGTPSRPGDEASGGHLSRRAPCRASERGPEAETAQRGGAGTVFHAGESAPPLPRTPQGRGWSTRLAPSSAPAWPPSAAASPYHDCCYCRG